MNCPSCKRQSQVSAKARSFRCPSCGAIAKLYPKRKLSFGKRCTVPAFNERTKKCDFLISIQGVSYQELLADKASTEAHLAKNYPGYFFPIFGLKASTQLRSV